MSENPPVVVDPKEITALAKQSGVTLMKDENVLVTGTPQRAPLRRYLAMNWALICIFTIIGIPFLPLAWWIAGAYVRKHGYWVTDSRVIVTNGIIGFRTRSIPLERVSDVAISCNWLEKWMGLRSVIVRDMTGEAMSGASMLAAPDATGLQHEILDQVHAVNRRSADKNDDVLMARPYRDGDSQSSEMMEVLRRIEANTRAKG
ncbi:MAG: PH domain-containing protein [Myxococcota bacterium]